MQTWQVHCGDALTVLKTLPDGCVDCVVTSPPYWGLRNYGHDGQIGLESSPAEFVAALVAVMAEARRVLRDEGTLWLNLGDSYAGGGQYGGGGDDTLTDKQASNRGSIKGIGRSCVPPTLQVIRSGELKQKDLVGIPWSVAFALRADGWYLRSEIIWHKKSCMPESVRDRPTKAHEQVFLLTKRSKYFYDQDAIREQYAEGTIAQGTGKVTGRGLGKEQNKQPNGGAQRSNSGGFPRSYSQEVSDDGQLLISDDLERFVTPETYDGEGQKDYASAGVQNPSAVKKRILAGAVAPGRGKWPDAEAVAEAHGVTRLTGNQANARMGDPPLGANARSVWSLGPEPATDIDHFAVMPKTLARRCILAGCPFGGTVLDPFAGSGTTGIVALEEGRSFIGIELNEKYHAISRQRLANTAPLLAQEGSLSAMFQP